MSITSKTLPDSATPFSSEQKKGRYVENDVAEGMLANHLADPSNAPRYDEVGGLGGALAGIYITLFLICGLVAIVAAGLSPIAGPPVVGGAVVIWAVISFVTWLVMAACQGFGAGDVKDPDMVASKFLHCGSWWISSIDKIHPFWNAADGSWIGGIFQFTCAAWIAVLLLKAVVAK